MNRKKVLLKAFLSQPLSGLVAFGQQLRHRFPLDYYWGQGRAFWPATVVFHPTARCNFRCQMCVVGSYDYQNEMSLNQIKKMIDQLAFFRPHFYIAGGEPLLRKDLEAMIKHAKQKGLFVTLATNGSLVTIGRAESLLRSGLDGVSVSIDGPEKINDLIRGRGNFKKAVRALKIIRKVKKRRGLILPKLKIACVISGYSYPHLEKMVILTKDLGVNEINFLHLDYKRQKIAQAHQKITKRFFGQATECLGYVIGNQSNRAEKKFVEVDPAAIKKQMKKINFSFRSVSVTFSPPVSEKKINVYYSGDYFAHFGCTNPWFSTTVLPNGDVVPCFSLKVGNLKQEKFVKLWNNRKYRRFRRLLKKRGHFPGCFRCCGTTDVK